MDSGIVGVILKKAGPVAGPIILAAALGAFAAWKSREIFDGGVDLKAQVVHLDSVTVKKDEFETALDNLRGDMQVMSKRQDSTNTLLRRVICQKQTIILCKGDQ